MQKPPKVYVVLVNYNGWADTTECLRSLRNLTYSNVQTVVVDNASIDHSVAQLKTWLTENNATGPTIQAEPRDFDDRGQSGLRISMFDWLQDCSEDGPNGEDRPLVLVESDQNLGFSGGNNLGIRYGISRGDSDFFWLLNNDTVVDVGALDELVSTFVERDCSDKPLAMCGSLILDFDRKDEIQAFGGGMVNRFLGTTRSLFAGEDVQSVLAADASVLPDYISGCSLLFKSDRIRRTGLLNEEYFLYWEDTEWSFRCKRRGMELAVSNRSKVWHRRGSTSGRFPIIGFYNTRNCLWFFRDYLPAYLPLCLLFKPLLFSAVALKHRNHRFFRESMRGYLEYFRHRGTK